jgi:hypothetical protein
MNAMGHGERFTFGCILKESEFVPRGGPR